jgi:hypothetical protein
MMDSTVAGNYEIWDIEAAGGFRTGIEVYPLLSLFRGVAWYGGLRLTLNDPDLILNLQTADAGGGLRRYLEEGGRLLLSAQNAVGDSAGLTPESAEEIFGISEFFTRRGSPNVDLPQNSVLYTALTGEADSVLVTSSTLGAEFFLLDADVEALFTVPPGFLARAYPHPQDVIVPDQRTQAAALGVFSTRLGRAALTSFIPSRANGYSNRDRIFAALFRRVLLP